MSWPWSQLGLPGPSGLSEVRHAYAEKLKTTHPEEDPEGFQKLHSAYQLASRMARQQKRETQVPETERPSRPAPEASRPPEEDFDFDELLQESGGLPRRPREAEPDWDYARLFAEGEAERAEYRRRRGEERRQKPQERRRQREDQGEQRRFLQERDSWQNTEAILHIMERMYHSQAGVETWKNFFMSPLFQENRDSLDLIFGLEDLISGRDLPQEVKAALFLAYGFEKGVSKPEQRPLFQMLLPAWKAERKAGKSTWKPIFFGILASWLFLFGIGPLLDSGLIPLALSALGLAFIVWVLRKAILLGDRERRARGQPVDKKRELRGLILAVVCVMALAAGLSWIQSRPGPDWRKLLPARDPRERTCRYIEQDFGVKVKSLYNQYPVEANDNIFYLESDTSKSFLAGPDGQRNGANTGYTTNLPEMMLFWALKEFALEHDMSPVNALDQGLGQERVSGIFLITLPEEDGEEIIDELGVLLEELCGERWYKVLPSQCELVMCSREMNEGRIVLIRVHPATEVYSAAQIRALYESTFTHSYCAQLLKELELDRDFLRGGEERYTLTNEGIATVRDRECYKLCGLDGTGAVAMEYYVDLEQSNIYCFPGDFRESGNSEDQLSFYRLLHWGDDLGLFQLFCPWLRVN